jgi:hypothetical protein
MRTRPGILFLPVVVATFFFVMGSISAASALIISFPKNFPHVDFADEPGLVWYNTSVFAPSHALDVEGELELAPGTLTELYKSDFKEGTPLGVDSGPFQSSYQTSFYPFIKDPTDATLTYLGSPLSYISGYDPVYLLIKNGSAWNFIYDLLALNWNGTDAIELKGFGMGGGGSISHVTIFGGDQTTVVPEPSTFALLGLGFLCLGLLGMRNRRNRRGEKVNS